jgi:alpha/beta superfamily hydrolase
VVVIPGRTLRIESDGPSLEALLHLPEGAPPFPGVVICHPHPQYGGDMYNNVVGALVRAVTGIGAAAVRFNFRGVGESEGAYDNGAGETQDVLAALGALRSQPEVDADRVALAGYSFGAMVMLRVASGRNDLRAVVSVANPTQRGPKVEIRMLAPTLFLVGDRDSYCDGQLILEYRDQIGDYVTVEIVKGVDHFWAGSDDRLIEIVQAFLRRTLELCQKNSRTQRKRPPPAKTARQRVRLPHADKLAS